MVFNSRISSKSGINGKNRALCTCAKDMAANARIRRGLSEWRGARSLYVRGIGHGGRAADEGHAPHPRAAPLRVRAAARTLKNSTGAQRTIAAHLCAFARTLLSMGSFTASSTAGFHLAHLAATAYLYAHRLVCLLRRCALLLRALPRSTPLLPPLYCCAVFALRCCAAVRRLPRAHQSARHGCSIVCISRPFRAAPSSIAPAPRVARIDRAPASACCGRVCWALVRYGMKPCHLVLFSRPSPSSVDLLPGCVTTDLWPHTILSPSFFQLDLPTCPSHSLHACATPNATILFLLWREEQAGLLPLGGAGVCAGTAGLGLPRVRTNIAWWVWNGATVELQLYLPDNCSLLPAWVALFRLPLPVCEHSSTFSIPAFRASLFCLAGRRSI